MDKKREGAYFKIKQVSPLLKMDIKYIANNLGISVNALLKLKLREIADSYPERMKQPIKD